jgi:FPC/CPF motif-containing protein YcgG
MNSSGPAQGHEALSRISDARFPCLGAKAAYGLGEITIHRGSNLHIDATALGGALEAFVRIKRDTSQFAVLAAIEDTFEPPDEVSFESYLWEVLSCLHRTDPEPWDPRYSGNPIDVSFKFSFAGRAFYVVGLSPVAARVSRRFPAPILIFNPVWQFEILRQKDRLERLIAQIRRRDIDLQGSINPNLRFEGNHSDALQYSGREVDDTWQCPFTPH